MSGHPGFGQGRRHFRNRQRDSSGPATTIRRRGDSRSQLSSRGTDFGLERCVADLEGDTSPWKERATDHRKRWAVDNGLCQRSKALKSGCSATTTVDTVSGNGGGASGGRSKLGWVTASVAVPRDGLIGTEPRLG